MSSKKYIRTNLSLAWPLAINALLMQSMLMIDVYLVSSLGEMSLAAMGIASTIISFVLGIQMAFANGSQLVLSRAVGSGQVSSLNKGFWAGLFINGMIGLSFWLALSLFDRVIVAWLTSDVSLFTETLGYLMIAKYIVVFNAITQVIIALFNARGKTRTPFRGYLIELPVNVLCSYFLIFGFNDFQGFGVIGAAAGSLIAIAIRLLYLVTCIFLDNSLKLSTRALDSSIKRNALNHFYEIFPVAANVTMLQVGATVYMLLYSQLSINAYVAITIVMPWVRAGTQFITAWALSSAITISQAIGARSLDDLRKNVDTSIDVSVAISFLSALFFLGLSLVLPSFYPELESSTYHALSAIAPLYIFLPIARGYNTVHGHVLRALGKTTEVFKVNFTGQWLIAIPLCALVIIYFDGSIFWAFAVMPLEEIVKMLPFRMIARKSLIEFDMHKADKLMYD